MAEIFKIVDETGEWHIQGKVPEDAQKAHKLIGIMHGVASRKGANPGQEMTVQIRDLETGETSIRS